MGVFFDKILALRNLTSAPVPLWKLNIDDAEYDGLKNVVKNAAVHNEFWKICKECALFYAESWRREYDGNVISKDIVASYANIPNKYAEKLFDSAKAALNSLHVPIIAQSNNLYFRTLLLQGGLPVRYILNKNGFNKFRGFLTKMIYELSCLSVNWNDVDVVKNLSCSNCLPPTYKNDNIYAVSLQIARAVIEERDDLFPYNTDRVELKDLTDVLKKEHNHIKRLKASCPLAIKWNLEILNAGNGLQGVFRYSLENVKTIYSDMIARLNSAECFQFDLFVSQRYVATYKKVKVDANVVVYRRVNSDNREFQWNGDCVVEVKLICDNGDELFPAVINGCAPNLAFPQMFQKMGGKYVQQKNCQSDECVVLYSQPWKLESGNAQEITIGGNVYGMCFLIANGGNQTVRFDNGEMGEQLELNNATSKYSAVFGGVYLSWLEKANYALLTNKGLFVDVYGEGGLKVKPLGVMYRQKGFSGWKPYIAGSLRPGIVDIKVCFPDGSSDIKTFYCIENLNFKVSNSTAVSARIQCNLNWGKIFPVKQENLSYNLVTATNCYVWDVERTPDTFKYPSTCSFEIHCLNNPILKISIPSPYEGLCFVKNEDELVPKNAILSFDEFAQCRILCSGNKSHSIKIGYAENGNLGVPISIDQDVKSGMTPLCNFEDAINRVVDVNGTNFFDSNSAVKFTIGNKVYEIRYFTMDSQVLNDAVQLYFLKPLGQQMVLAQAFNNAVQFSKGILGSIEGHVYACRISEPKDDFQPLVYELERSNCDSFKFPKNLDDGVYKVFSGMYDVHRIIPQCYQIDNGCLIAVANDVMLSAEKWADILSTKEVNDDNTWGKILQYLEIADRWRLPFGTFNAVSAAVSSPKLMIKLLCRFLMDDKVEFLLSIVLKIEREYAVAFHWNRPDIVKEIFDQVTGGFPNAVRLTFFQKFSEILERVMTITLDSDVAQLMTRFLLGNLPNVNPDLLTNAEINDFKSRAVGKNSSANNVNSDLPTLNLELKKSYYFSGIKMLPYQKTLIESPLYVYEYTQELNDSLWNSSPDGIRRRRIINFYRLHYKYTYYSILVKMLK